jgi:regulator of replication initiation timing
LNSDYELVKQEYQRTIERNEEILVENRRLRGVIQNTKISTPEKRSILGGGDIRTEVI